MTMKLIALWVLLAPLALAQSLPSWASPDGEVPAGPTAAMAPPQPPGGGPVEQVPLDGGLGLLALAGGAFAARRLRR